MPAPTSAPQSAFPRLGNRSPCVTRNTPVNTSSKPMAGQFQLFAERAVPASRARSSGGQNFRRTSAYFHGFVSGAGGDEEREGQQVRMKIRVKEREERELVDRLDRADDPGGVPVVEVAA